jgi:hypothetical protein
MKTTWNDPGRDEAHRAPHNKLSRFCASEDGAMTAFGIFVLLIMLAIGGVGVDYMAYERNRVVLQKTLDNAVLAATDLSQSLEPESVVHDYFTKVSFHGEIQSIGVTEDAYSRSVTGNVASSYTTRFMHMLGIDDLPQGVQAAAVERKPFTEISLVLDISGSMGVDNRLPLMQEAAKRFVTKSLERNYSSVTGTTNNKIASINIIPFAGQVNPGADMFEYVGGERFGTTTSEDYFPEWQQDISNVVFWFDLDGDSEIDYSVKIEGYPDLEVDLFNKDDLDTYYLYAIDYIEKLDPTLAGKMTMLGATIKGGVQPTTFYGIIGDIVDGPTKFNKVDLEIQFNDFYADIVPNNTSSCLELVYDDFLNSSWPVGTTEQVPYFVNWDFDAVTQNWGWCPDDEMAIQYAQDSEAELHTFIDGIRLFDGTGTNYGMKYAVALLDPTTQPTFEYLSTIGKVPTSYANRPLAWNADDSTKVIVLLTDGRTSTQVRPTDELEFSNKDTELTLRPEDDTTVEATQLTNLELFKVQCSLAKELGVVIYTVALETSDVATQEIMECASSQSHFFEVTGPEVIDAFVAIASSIQRLRLYQ